eukprot:3223855-Pleurochrysis_carterae.AAC.2
METGGAGRSEASMQTSAVVVVTSRLQARLILCSSWTQQQLNEFAAARLHCNLHLHREAKKCRAPVSKRFGAR